MRLFPVSAKTTSPSMATERLSRLVDLHLVAVRQRSEEFGSKLPLYPLVPVPTATVVVPLVRSTWRM